MANVFTAAPLNIPEAEYLADLAGIQFDLLTAQQFAQLLIDRLKAGDTMVAEPLTTAIVVRYCRPFAKGVRARLSDQDLVAAGCDASQMSTHRYLKALRDKHVAHSVNVFEENHVGATHRLNRPEDGFVGIQYGHSRMAAFGPERARDVIDLAATIVRLVQRKIAKEQETLLALVKTMDPQSILQAPPLEAFDVTHRDVEQVRPQQQAKKRRHKAVE